MNASPRTVTLVYFSQTGNTRRVAEEMAEALRSGGNKVSTLPMKDVQQADLEGCDVLGMGAPCFESQAPTPVKDFLQAWPLLHGKPAFVFATAGGAPGRVLHDLAAGLQKKGAVILGGFMCRGMVHHPAPCLTGRMPARPNREDLERARSFALAVDRHLRSGASGAMAEGRKDALIPNRGFYDLVSFIAKPFLLRILLPGPRPDHSQCIQCGSCMKECPVQSIDLKPYPVADSKCIRCYHCLNTCPQKALNVSWQFGNLVIFSLYNTLFFRLFGDLEPGERIY